MDISVLDGCQQVASSNAIIYYITGESSNERSYQVPSLCGPWRINVVHILFIHNGSLMIHAVG